jgi:hypothetical protein
MNQRWTPSALRTLKVKSSAQPVRTQVEGRHVNRENVQPIKQITPEGPRAHGGLQVTVGGGDYPDVSVDSTATADALKLMLLQNTQEGNLGLGWEFSEFIEE